MRRFRMFAVCLLLTTPSFFVLAPPTAHAEIPSSGLVWAPQTVVYPVNPDDVLPAPPFVPEKSHETSGVIEVGPGKGAAFYLDGLEIARARVISGDGAPRFRRVFGGSRSSVQTGLRATVDVGAWRDADGAWLISEPAGDGDVWVVDADVDLRIQLEHPRTLPGKLSWEDARSSLLQAIETGEAIPRLPGDEGSSRLEAELAAHRALGAALIEAGGSALTEAVHAWQAAAALRALDEIRPFAWPYWSVEDVGQVAGQGGERILRVDGEIASNAVWRRVTGAEAAIEVEVEGPGILRVQARSVLPVGTSVAREPTRLTVERDGVLARALLFVGRPARVTDKPDAAFPVREVLVTQAGEWAGKINEVRISLAPGRHTYRIDTDQDVLLRVQRARYRGMAVEGVADRGSPEEAVAAGQQALAAQSGPVVDLLRGLLADVQGEPPPAQSPGLPAQFVPVAEYLAAAHGIIDPRPRVTSWTQALAGTNAPPWAWWLRVRMAELLPQGTGVRGLYAAAVDLPPPGLLAPAAAQLGAPGLYQDRPDRGVGALELAWRALPADLGVRSTYLREFLDTTTWSRLSPVVLVSGDAITPPPMTWLDTAAGTGGPVSRAARVYYRIPGGASRTYTVAPSPADSQAPAVFSVLLHSPADAGLVSLSVDDRTFRVLPLAEVEKLDFAVPPGTHSMTLSTTAGADAWVSGTPTDEQWRQVQDLATIRSYWPTSIRGTTPHFEIPSPQVPVPIRVELRALSPNPQSPAVTARLRSDTGVDWPITLRPGGADPTLLPIGGEAPLSAVATVTLYLPAGTQQVWVDAPPEAQLVVSMSVRRTEVLDTAPILASGGAPSLADVDALSRRIAANPTDAAALLRRADMLAQLEDTDMARQDLRRLLALGDVARAQVGDEAIDAVSERLDAANVSGWLPATGVLEGLRSPMPLSAELVVGEDAAPPPAIVAIATKARTEGAAAALALLETMDPDAPALDWFRGRLLWALDRDVEASMRLIEAWRTSGAWQYGLEAAGWLVASEVGAGQAPTLGTASVGYGLASDLRGQVSHPTVERLALLTGRRSRWDTVRGADDSAGRARVTSTSALTPPLPLSEIRTALTTAPWPSSEAQFVTSKEPAVVTTNSGAPMVADVWCQPLRVGSSGVEPGCTADLLVDGVSVARKQLAPRTQASLQTPALADGRHDIQVSLDDPGRTSALSVRFRSTNSRSPLRPLRDTAAFLASRSQPFTVSVAGPGTVFLEVRSSDGQGGMADLHTVGPKGALPVQSLVLPATVDTEVSATTSGRVGVAATAFVVLPTEGTWTVTVAPRAGSTLVRGALRQETPSPTIDRPGPLWRDVAPDTEPFDWPAITPTITRVEAGVAPPEWHIGTFSLGIGYGQPGMTDGGASDPVEELETSLAWRYQVMPRRLWLRVQPAYRVVPEADPVMGGEADVLARLAALDLRLLGSGQYYQQSVAGASASGAAAGLRVYRPIQTHSGSYLIPSLEAKGRFLSLDAAPDEVSFIDPDVFSSYAAAHPFGLIPSLAFWTMPRQDLVGLATLGAVTNADLGSLDRVSLAVEGRAVIHPGGVPPFQVQGWYRPAFRLAGDYRDTSYLDHTLGAELGAYIPLGTPLSLWLGLADALTVGGGQSASNVFLFQTRFDLHGGRALQDRLPVEEDFFDLLGSDRWGPLSEEGL